MWEYFKRYYPMRKADYILDIQTSRYRRLSVCTNASLPFRQDTYIKVLTIYCNSNTHFMLSNKSKYN